MKLTYIIILLITTLAVAIICRKRSPLCTPLLIGFLFFTILVELIANILKYTFDANNLGVYNLYMYFSFICWFWWLTKEEGANRYPFFIASSILAVTAITEMFFHGGFNTVHTYVFTIGTLSFVSLFILRIYRAYAITDALLPAYELVFLCSGLGFYVLFFLDTIFYPTGLLSKPVWRGYNWDQILTRVTNYYFYLMMMASIIMSCLPFKKLNKISPGLSQN